MLLYGLRVNIAKKLSKSAVCLLKALFPLPHQNGDTVEEGGVDNQEKYHVLKGLRTTKTKVVGFLNSSSGRKASELMEHFALQDVVLGSRPGFSKLPSCGGYTLR